MINCPTCSIPCAKYLEYRDDQLDLADVGWCGTCGRLIDGEGEEYVPAQAMQLSLIREAVDDGDDAGWDNYQFSAELRAILNPRTEDSDAPTR